MPQSWTHRILGSLPYTASRKVEDTNPKYKAFEAASGRRDEIIRRLSVSRNSVNNPMGYDNMMTDKGYHSLIYAPLDENKINRINEYRRMSDYSELSDCLDIICDEILNEDENGKLINLRIEAGKYNQTARSEITKEFEHYVSVFGLKNKGWEYFRQFFIEGELFFENVISDKNPELGVLGVVNVPTELIEPVYFNVQNEDLSHFILRKYNETTVHPGIFNRVSFTSQTPTTEELVPMQKQQVVYIHSGVWDRDRLFKVPYLEKSKRAYLQLSMIEDAIVIYRLVRAPERLKFKIYTGNAPPAQAEQIVQQAMRKFWEKRTPGQGGFKNVYDPQSMLDSYWFARSSGGEGSDVETVPAGQNLGQLDDLNYFVKKLYRSMKIPLNRMNPETTMRDGKEITAEELSMAQFIMRIQRQFAEGIKQGFITHLKLRGLWKLYKIREFDFQPEFNAPRNFKMMRDLQYLELLYKAYNDVSSNANVSPTLLMMDVLKWSPEKILENRALLRKDKAFAWELEQIGSQGPSWRDEMAAANASAGITPPESPPSGGGGGSELPPSFSPPPAEAPAPPPEETPAAPPEETPA
jgi:hypothetical protein